MKSSGDKYQSQENIDQVENMKSQVSNKRRNSSISMNSQDSGTRNESVHKETSLDGLNWTALWEEFTLKRMWTDRSWKDMVKNFLMVLLLGLIPSGYDVISDGFLARDFLGGTDYTRHVTTNFTEPPAENCTHIKNIYDLSDDGSEILVGQSYTCFEKDPIWGYVAFAFLILPGYLGGWQVDLTQHHPELIVHIQVWEGLYKCPRMALTVLVWPFFPLLLIGAKAVGLFNLGAQPGSAMEETLLSPHCSRRKI